MIGRAAKDILIHIKADDKKFQSAIKSSDASMGAFASKMKAYSPMIGAAFVTAAAGVVAMSVKMAAAEEAVSRQTEALLKSQGIMWKNVSGELDSYMKQLEDLTAYNDTDLQQAFNTMIAAGMSYTEAMESMNTVTSMAYSLNRDLATMALLVGKAYNGQTGELSRYGIVLGDIKDKTEAFNKVQEFVADNFADASDRADTYEGNMETLKNETSNFLEAMGDPLLDPLSKFIGLLADGSEESTSFATKLGELIAIPFDISTASLRLKPLEEELAMIKNIEAAGMLTAEGEKRKHQVIIEMMQIQNGEWENRKEYVSEFMDKQDEIIEKDEHEIILMYQKMGANEAFLNTLRAELEIKQNITNEDKEQLSLTERKAAFLARPLSAKQRSASAALRLSPLGPVGETRQSGQWTIGPSVASTRSGV